MLLPTLAATVALAVTPAPAAAPTVMKYKVAQRLMQVIDLSSVGQPPQEVLIKLTTFMTVRMADSAGGKSFTATIDSLKGDSLPPQMPPQALDGAKGASWSAFIDATGKMSNLKASQEVQGVGGLQGILNEFLPRVRAPLTAGKEWTDTTQVNAPIGGGTLTTNTVTNFKVIGPATRGKAKTTRVDAAFAGAVAGSQDAGAGTMEIDGTTSGKISYFLDAAGTLVGSDNESEQNLTLTAPGAPGPIPVKVNSTVTISALE